VVDPKTRPPHALVDLQRQPAESPEVGLLGYTLLLEEAKADREKTLQKMEKKLFGTDDEA